MSSIEEAHSQARYFVLLASPEAAASHWVDQEVRWWRENRGHETVLIVLTDGELDWDDDRGDFATTAAIPPGLRGWFPREPLWVDLRWARDEHDLSMRNGRFRDSVAELAAPIRGVPKDELIGEDISQHRRTLRLARGAVSLLVLRLALAAVGGIVALVQRNNARNQTELRRRRINRTIAHLSWDRVHAGWETDELSSFHLAHQKEQEWPVPQIWQALSASSSWHRIAGVVGLVLCAPGLYAALAMALEDARSKTMLPLGRRARARSAIDGDLDRQTSRLEAEAGVREQL